MNWIVTSTGREHYLSGPAADRPDNVPILCEISHSLAQINRFTGHCKRPYSVAEHSLLVSDLAQQDGAPTRVVLAALLHDAHECIVGDVASPLKAELGEVWQALEAREQTRLQEQFGIATVSQLYAKQIKHWDLVALATERADLMAWHKHLSTPWPTLDTYYARIYRCDTDLMSEWRCNTNWVTWACVFKERGLQLMNQLRINAQRAA
ncbi:MAG: HD domain-containing protein [Rhodoferax sp.]|nr:HD domain-containing protein [Rhodoferax sp.]